MSEAIQPPELSWGCIAHRACQNLLAGSAHVSPDVAEFLLFDQKAKQLWLCRYLGHLPSCKTHALASPEEAALQNPRQLQLCPRRPFFASLEISGGRARAAVWRITGAIGGSQAYCAAPAISGAESARAIGWASNETRVSTKPDTAVLCVLLSAQVLLVSVAEGPQGLVVERCLRLDTGFPTACFAWSKDGSQLLVGGAGQILCFAWTKNKGHEKTGSPEHPLSRHFLCNGGCVEIHAVHSTGFLCRVDQKVQETQISALMLPGGCTAPVLQQPLVQEVGESNVIDLREDGLCSAPADRRNPAESGLQIVPGHRCLLPLCCPDQARPVQDEPRPNQQKETQRTSANCNTSRRREQPRFKRFTTSSRPLTRARCQAGLPRLQCGRELKVEGEFVAVADGSGKACVIVGSFRHAEISVFSLAPPQSWKQAGDGGDGDSEWCQLTSVDLSPPSASMRLSGCLSWTTC